MHVGLIGSADFDVGSVDPSSLLLRRSDGIGKGVAPWSRGGSVRMVDVGGSSSPGEACDCVDRRPDGTFDILLKFRVNHLVRAMALQSVREPTVLELTLDGFTKGGEAFAASDCVTVMPLRRPRRHSR